ncbi:MAG TPA: LysR substrate-binding domain-containing protein, partial [Dongiaceae bacterium]
LDSVEMIVNESARSLASPAFQALANRATLTVRNVASLLAMVQAGMGVTLLPALATASMPGTLRALAMADPAAVRTVGLISRQGRDASPLAAAFQDALVAAVRRRANDLGLTLPSEFPRRIRGRGTKKIAGSEDPAS